VNQNILFVGETKMGQSLDKTRDYLNSVKEGLRSILRETWRYKLTHEKMLERRKAIYASEAYKRLPRWAEAEISGFFEAAYDLQINQRIFWTHVLDGKRVLSHDPSLDGKHGTLDSDLSYHCYLVRIDGKVQMIPFIEKDRAKELVSKRLTQDDLDAIKRRMMPENDVIDVYLTHKPNGTPVPAILTQVVGMPL
jgi:hypothetical protein